MFLVCMWGSKQFAHTISARVERLMIKAFPVLESQDVICTLLSHIFFISYIYLIINIFSIFGTMLPTLIARSIHDRGSFEGCLAPKKYQQQKMQSGGSDSNLSCISGSSNSSIKVDEDDNCPICNYLLSLNKYNLSSDFTSCTISRIYCYIQKFKLSNLVSREEILYHEHYELVETFINQHEHIICDNNHKLIVTEYLRNLISNLKPGICPPVSIINELCLFMQPRDLMVSMSRSEAENFLNTQNIGSWILRKSTSVHLHEHLKNSGLFSCFVISIVTNLMKFSHILVLQVCGLGYFVLRDIKNRIIDNDVEIHSGRFYTNLVQIIEEIISNHNFGIFYSSSLTRYDFENNTSHDIISRLKEKSNILKNKIDEIVLTTEEEEDENVKLRLFFMEHYINSLIKDAVI